MNYSPGIFCSQARRKPHSIRARFPLDESLEACGEVGADDRGSEVAETRTARAGSERIASLWTKYYLVIFCPQLLSQRFNSLYYLIVRPRNSTRFDCQDDFPVFAFV